MPVRKLVNYGFFVIQNYFLYIYVGKIFFYSLTRKSFRLIEYDVRKLVEIFPYTITRTLVYNGFPVFRNHHQIVKPKLPDFSFSGFNRKLLYFIFLESIAITRKNTSAALRHRGTLYSTKLHHGLVVLSGMFFVQKLLCQQFKFYF